LSRKYAYQVLLIEELTRHGVEVVFIRSPKAQTPEEQLLLQFQGMISEYERAQIAERTRRGKRHRAWALFLVFLLMACLDIPSIERAKHVRSRETGAVLGLIVVPQKHAMHVVLRSRQPELGQQGNSMNAFDCKFVRV
jgi:Resolvase, N terminal domain